MNNTASLIISLLPIIDRLIFDIGGKLIELNTSNLTKEDLIKSLNESQDWPKLKFLTTAP